MISCSSQIQPAVAIPVEVQYAQTREHSFGFSAMTIVHPQLISADTATGSLSPMSIAMILTFFTGITSLSARRRYSLHTAAYLVILLVSAADARCSPALVKKSPDLAVYAEKSSAIGAEKLFRLYPDVKHQLETDLGVRLSGPVTVILRTSIPLQGKNAEGAPVVAFAIPQQNLIIIDYPRVLQRPFSLHSVLKHELCHLLLHAAVPADSLPRWLDEGIAQFMSEGVGELLITDHSHMLHQAVRSGKAPELSRIAHAFPSDAKMLLVAYAQSRSFIEYLAARYGASSLTVLLACLVNGSSVDDAFLATFKLRQSKLESEWRSSLLEPNPWFTWTARHSYTLLFTLAALLTVAGFLRRRAKRGELDDS